MNCLKCPNFWQTDIDETKCDKCGLRTAIAKTKEEEVKKDGEKASDLR